MNRLTNHNKEIPTLTPNNAKFWKDVYFKLSKYEDMEESEKYYTLEEAYTGNTRINFFDGKDNSWTIVDDYALDGCKTMLSIFGYKNKGWLENEDENNETQKNLGGIQTS